MKDQLIDAEEEHRRLRRIAFVAVAISTVAIFSSIITTPIIYTYIQSIQSNIEHEGMYCRHKAKDMWVEVNAIHESMVENGSVRIRRDASAKDEKADQRSKRAWMFGKWSDTGSDSNNGNGAGGYGSSNSGGGYGGVQPSAVTSNGYEQPSNSYQAAPPSGYDAPVLAPEPQIEQCLLFHKLA
uniref:Nematode cuticle collagen N-terminal domain-containing protein n=1 Tax=Panagrolaimus sp. ES5 TaxID=591445 RepID=A0AC34FBX5_9BILA